MFELISKLVVLKLTLGKTGQKGPWAASAAAAVKVREQDAGV
jgi:hypothetical protein